MKPVRKFLCTRLSILMSTVLVSTVLDGCAGFSDETALAVTAASAPVKIIFDTDLGVDVDDAGALAVLHSLADIGQATILATVANVYDPYAPGALDAINTYYGRPNIPVGRSPHPAYYPVANAYWRGADAPQADKALQTGFPNDTGTTRLRSAVSVYREVLARQADRSVTVVGVGFFVNLDDLLRSGPDRYSPLTGTQLVAAKVKELVVMAGTYRDFYLNGGVHISADPARRVLADWPTPIVMTPGTMCVSFSVGHTLSTRVPVTNPVRKAYEVYTGLENKGRPGWDLCTVFYAVRGLSDSVSGPLFRTTSDTHLTVTSTEAGKWVAPGNHHRRLYRVVDDATMQRNLEYRVTKPPRRSSVTAR